MREELGDAVPYVPAGTTFEVVKGLAGLGRLDVVHAHMTAGEIAAILSRLANRAPIVSTRHFPDARLCRLPLLFGRFVGRALAMQIAISDFVARRIGEESTVIHNGVIARPQNDLDEPVALMLQRLQPEKSPTVGVEAWAKSGLGDEGWTLLIAGSGALEGSLRGRVAELGVGESVTFLGLVSATEELLRRAALLIAPAPAEPFGLSVVEAMAYGIPVVAARGGAHVETLGDDGLFFEPGDTVAAAAHLAALGRSHDLRVSVGRRLRARQRERFSLEEHVTRLEDVYRSIARMR
jgi:glycosyltransferase involved in cell wall biosynthesis